MPVAKDGTITGLATQLWSWLALKKMVKLEGRTGMKFSSRGSALSIWVVGRTSLNSRKALDWIRSIARCSSSIPGSSMTNRSAPTFWISGSATPNSSMRLRIIRSERSM